MRNFTKEEIEVLSKYETNLKSASELNFMHYSPMGANDIVADIYTAAGGTIHRNWSCSHCVLQLWKLAGKHYFDSKKALEEEPVVEVEKQPNKRGRKKSE